MPLENDGKSTLGVVVPGNNAFWKSVEYGANDAAGDNDLHLIWKSDSSTDSSEWQIRAIEGFISQKLAGLIVSPNSRFELQSTIKKAVERGMIVVSLDSESLMSREDEDHSVTLVMTDQFAAGQLAAETMASLINEKGRLAIIRYSAMTTVTEKREEGFLSKIRQYPEIELVYEDMYVGSNPELAPEKLRTFLHIYCPNGRAGIDGIFVSHESTACELLELMRFVEFDKKINFVAFGTDSRLVTGMLTYLVDALIVEQPVKMGKLAVETLANRLRGEAVAPVVECGTFTITIDNISTPYAQALLNPSSDEAMEILLAAPAGEEPENTD